MKTGVQWVCNSLKELDSGFRRNDRKVCFPTFYGFIKFGQAILHGMKPRIFGVRYLVHTCRSFRLVIHSRDMKSRVTHQFFLDIIPVLSYIIVTL